MSLIASMTIAGTIPLLLHYLMKAVLKERYTSGWRKWMLYLSVFFYLCPFQELKYSLPVTLPVIFYDREPGKRYYLKKAGYMAVKFSSDGYTLVPVWLVCLEIVWIFVVIAFIVIYVKKYCRLKRELWNTSELVNIETADDFFGMIPERTCKKKGIYYMKNEAINTPLTIGILWKRCIIIPDNIQDEETERMIYLHEYTHIRNKDILKKIICVGTALLHWFNPAVWLLVYEFGEVAEQICDEKVVQQLETQDEKKKYVRLLLDLAVQEPEISVSFVNYLSHGEKNMKRRMKRILGHHQKTAWIVPFAMILIVMLSSSTAIAYRMPVPFSKEMIESAKEETFIWFEYDGIEYLKELDFSESNTIFVDGFTGESIPVKNTGEAEVYAECSHTYMVGRYYNHEKNSSGGCEMVEYSAYRCTKCGKIVIQKIISEIVYPICPH